MRDNPVSARLLFIQALRRRAPSDGITRWLHGLAHNLGYAERTVEGWYYGEHLPNIEQFDDLRTHFGDELTTEVYPARSVK